MKKYVKPDLYFESFQLSQHIAACGYDINSADIYSCVSTGDTHGKYPTYDLTFFAETNGGCMIEPDRYCYTNGTDSSEAVKVLVS